MRVILLARDKKKNYSYDDSSAKTEADEDGPKVDRKESAKKKKGKKMTCWMVYHLQKLIIVNIIINDIIIID